MALLCIFIIIIFQNAFRMQGHCVFLYVALFIVFIYLFKFVHVGAVVHCVKYTHSYNKNIQILH